MMIVRLKILPRTNNLKIDRNLQGTFLVYGGKKRHIKKKQHLGSNFFFCFKMTLSFNSIFCEPLKFFIGYLNNTVIQLDLIGMSRTLHPTTAEHTASANAHRMLAKIEHILGHRTNLTKFSRTQIIHNMLSKPSEIK